MTKIEEILIEFQAQGITHAQLEHTLDLDEGAFERANLIDDPEVIALLKIVRTYPWLLKVCDCRFDEFESKRILLHEATDIFINQQVNKTKI